MKDVFYSISLAGIFLAFNVFTLERQRWAGNPVNPQHRRWRLVTILLVANFLLLNFWLVAGAITPDVLLGGMFSGLASTGLYEAFRNLIQPKAEA